MVAQDITLHDVWKDNLEEEFANLRKYLKDYPFVAMDTEFPGITATCGGQFPGPEGFNYQLFTTNVNATKLIQVGLVLTNKQGELPPDNDVWQFNFQFNPAEDMAASESIEILRKAGLDFARHQADGIKMEDFGELLTPSGLVVNKKVTWITFHSCFDFGYLFRCIFYGPLPDNEQEFFRIYKTFFPVSYDIKLLLQQPGPQQVMLKGGLQEVANQLQVARIGQAHQAGSDSLLTVMTFFKLRERFFSDNWNLVSPKVQGHMFGISSNGLSSANSAATPILSRE